ncbi:DUF4465 domain-containing protein [Flammeovirga kamogawensis]|uniref:DUF4465 domain-containing protein n=1 Tax=Flammeovirga kamogawensis TaxID=373891 RepID=A0ABX8GSA8_9BACT|nr:DUF4465 domain-containing protein [Flammeovirga kamogawensis]MBB6461405.1 hypothetical protein [Flammeovirga kamogawensis]QWG06304.1 DUF4465 domain-containing protein [Flammeovirga kamogawensis]
MIKIRMINKRLYTFLLIPLLFSCGVNKESGPRLEVTIIQPKIDPTTAQALQLKGQKFVYESKTIGGDTDSYKWEVDNQVIGTSLLTDSVSYDTEGVKKARFSVTNSAFDAYAEIEVLIVKYMAFFDDLTLSDNSFWVGDATNGSASTFTTGNVVLPNTSPKIDGDNSDDFYNFGYSNITDSSSNDFHKYGVYLKVPASSVSNFGLARMKQDKPTMNLIFDTELYPISISIANSPDAIAAADSILKSGDTYILEVRGINSANEQTEELASLTLITGVTDTISAVTKWTKLELNTLGRVKGLNFTINSTKKDPDTGALDLEAKFCLDNLLLVESEQKFNPN